MSRQASIVHSRQVSSAPRLPGLPGDETSRFHGSDKNQLTLPRPWSVTEIPQDACSFRGMSRPGSRAGNAIKLHDWLGTGSVLSALDVSSRPVTTTTRPSTTANSMSGIRSRPSSEWQQDNFAGSRPQSGWKQPEGWMPGGPFSPKNNENPFRLLYGISYPTEVENENYASRQSTLFLPRAKEADKSAKIQPIGMDVDLSEKAEGLVSRIAEVRATHQAFEGHPLDLQSGGPQKIRNGKREEDTGERESRRERFEAYKMHRRIEPELPPLIRSELPIDAGNRDVAINYIARNASQVAILACSPSEKMRADAPHWVEVGRQRELTRERSLAILSSKVDKWDEEMKRKKRQAERTIANKRKVHGAPKAGAIAAENWLKFYAIHAFARALHSELEISHMPTKARLEYLSSRQSSPTQHTTSIMSTAAAQLHQVMADEKFAKLMTIVGAMYRFKQQVEKRRREMRKIWRCMNHWKGTGQFCVTMQRYVKIIRFLQRWWRACSKRLRQIRDKISKRWVQLERIELARELNKAEPREPPPRKGKPARDSLYRMSLEERIEYETVDEGVRLQFLDNELRVRRFMLLPAIAMWEEEVRRWHESAQDLQATAEIASTLKVDKTQMQPTAFRWPPTRPSYMPPSHPSSEQRGAPCPEHCPGRKGDAEILAMCRLARENPEGDGWREVPTARTQIPTASRVGGTAKQLPKKQASTKRKEEKDQERPFGEVQDDELVKWGLDPKVMPGSDGPKGIRTAAGDGEGGITIMAHAM